VDDRVITLESSSCNWLSSWGSSGKPNDKGDGGNRDLHFVGGLLGFGFKKGGCFVLRIDGFS
jgi:hypothetical protein